MTGVLKALRNAFPGVLPAGRGTSRRFSGAFPLVTDCDESAYPHS